MDVPFNIQVYLVDLIGFQKCDISRGQPITDEPRSSEFAVPNQFLSVGSNYFIGKFKSRILLYVLLVPV